MYRIQTDGYKTDDKYIIARDYLIPKIEKNVNFEKDQIIFPEETINYISKNLTDKEKGVRNLKRCLEIIYTKLNLYRLMKKGSILFNEKEIITVEFPFIVTLEIISKLIKKTKEGGAPFGMYI
jgi:ATP-dependent Lon protease